MHKRSALQGKFVIPTPVPLVLESRSIDQAWGLSNLWDVPLSSTNSTSASLHWVHLCGWKSTSKLTVATEARLTFFRVDVGLQSRKAICHALRAVPMSALFSICCFILIWTYVLRDKQHIAWHEAAAHINLPSEARRTSENIELSWS